jgi:hypothetical protein
LWALQFVLFRKAQFLFVSMYLHSATAQSLHDCGSWKREEKWSPLLGILAKDDETINKALSGIKSHISCVPDHYNSEATFYHAQKHITLTQTFHT